MLALVASGCAKKLDLKMAVDVLSDPQKAQVKYKNKSLGEAPQSVSINTFDDLQAITATTLTKTGRKRSSRRFRSRPSTNEAGLREQLV